MAEGKQTDSSTFRIRLAEVAFDVQPLSADLAEFCARYIEEGPERQGGEADHLIRLTDDDLRFEDELTLQILQQHAISREESEQLALCRKAAEKLVLSDTLLMHGAAIRFKGRAYIFTAPSGTGKTTHVSLWEKRFGDQVTIINGDKPFLKIRQDGVFVYGSPWSGKEQQNANVSAPLAGIACLQQAEENRAEPMGHQEKWEFLLNQMNRSLGPQQMAHALHLLDRLIGSVPIFRLCCDPHPQAVETALAAFRKYEICTRSRK